MRDSEELEKLGVRHDMSSMIWKTNLWEKIVVKLYRDNQEPWLTKSTGKKDFPLLCLNALDKKWK